MLVKGIFIGIGASIVSVLFFLRWLSAHAPSPGPMAVDIRSIERFLLSLFGGITIGACVVAMVLFAGGYALRMYAEHMIK